MSWEDYEVDEDGSVESYSQRRGVHLILWKSIDGDFIFTIHGPTGSRGRVRLASTDLADAKVEVEKKIDAMNLSAYLGDEGYEIWLEKMTNK